MKVLITGGAGFIGSHLSELLLESGHEVWALDEVRADEAGAAGDEPGGVHGGECRGAIGMS